MWLLAVLSWIVMMTILLQMNRVLKSTSLSISEKGKISIMVFILVVLISFWSSAYLFLR